MRRIPKTLLLTGVLTALSFPVDLFAQESAAPVDTDGDGYSEGVIVQSNGEPTFVALNTGTGTQKAIQTVCSKINTSGWLWKPASQDSGGAREGKPMILISRNLPSGKKSLKVYDVNGENICKLKKWSSERYYLGTGCRKTARQLKEIAKNSSGGTSTVYVEGPGSQCYGPVPDPTKRRDKR